MNEHPLIIDHILLWWTIQMSLYAFSDTLLLPGVIDLFKLDKGHFLLHLTTFED